MNPDPEMERRAEARARALLRRSQGRAREVGELEPRAAAPHDEADASRFREKLARVYAPSGYRQPVVVAVLYVFAAIAAAFGLFALRHELAAGVVLLVSAFSLVAWAQMLEHIARAAYYAQRTAELLEEQSRK